MSIVIKNSIGRRFVFVKGADSSMLKYSNQVNTDKIIQEVEDFASQGLRTLVFGYRELQGLFTDVANMTSEEVECEL
jgi:magnesium-transporting ATPase (P-type)